MTQLAAMSWETATHPNTPPEKLVELSKSKWALVREAVAKHPRASEAFIATKGKKTGVTVLDKLAFISGQAVKIAVVENPNTSIKLLEAIINANKYSSNTCLVAVKHLLERAPERAEKHLFHYYEQMGDSELSNFILEHPAAPIDLLNKKLRLLSWMERYTITQNHKSSRAILEILAGDANRVVRGAAREKLLNFDPPNPPRGRGALNLRFLLLKGAFNINLVPPLLRLGGILNSLKHHPINRFTLILRSNFPLSRHR